MGYIDRQNTFQSRIAEPGSIRVSTNADLLGRARQATRCLLKASTVTNWSEFDCLTISLDRIGKLCFDFAISPDSEIR